MHAQPATPILDPLGAFPRVALMLALSVTILVTLLRIAPFV